MTQFSPIDEKYLTAARSLGMKNPEKMHPDMLMRTLGALTSSPQTAKPGAIASDYRGPGDQARAIASVARRNGIPYTLCEPHPRKRVRKSYADNFAFGKLS